MPTGHVEEINSLPHYLLRGFQNKSFAAVPGARSFAYKYTPSV